eukprot:snap_masked-scaffold_29-processed-gene-3.13-mRNA-1 protein AED:0.36 eAED:1.00 QI:0/-1/0/1/-1/1/1/0/119
MKQDLDDGTVQYATPVQVIPDPARTSVQTQMYQPAQGTVDAQPTVVQAVPLDTQNQANQQRVTSAPVYIQPQQQTVMYKMAYIGPITCLLVILFFFLIGPFSLLFLCCPVDTRTQVVTR